jgi:hypothetical protein
VGVCKLVSPSYCVTSRQINGSPFVRFARLTLVMVDALRVVGIRLQLTVAHYDIELTASNPVSARSVSASTASWSIHTMTGRGSTTLRVSNGPRHRFDRQPTLTADSNVQDDDGLGWARSPMLAIPRKFGSVSCC